MQVPDLMPWLPPIAFLLGGVLFGFILEKIVLGKLKKAAAATQGETDDMVAYAFRRLPLLWLTLGGLYGAILTSPFPLPNNRFQALQNILMVLLILSIVALFSRIITGGIDVYSRRQTGLLHSASILKNLGRAFIYILGLLMIFYSLGINITPALTALGVGGIAVALALQDTLSNFFSGLQILASRQIAPGHFVKLQSGEEGYVSDITWRNTTLQTLTNHRVIVPNSKLASDVVTNYSLPDKEITVLIPVGVAYGSELSSVERVTLEVATEVMKEVAGGVPSFEPAVRYHAFADSGILFNVMLRAKEYADQGMIKHEFVKRLHMRYAAEGIQIPYPTRTIYMQEHSSQG